MEHGLESVICKNESDKKFCEYSHNISKKIKILETKINTKVDVIRILIQVYLLRRLLNLWKIEMYKNMQSVNYVQKDSTKWSSYYYYLKDETDIIRYNLTSLVVIHKTSTV